MIYNKMIFINKVSCNIFTFIVVIAYTNYPFNNKPNLLGNFPCFGKILAFGKF